MPTYIRDAGAWLSVSGDSGIPPGTLMLFQQTTAPTGWTKQTTHDNKALRVVSGTCVNGGTTAFTSVFTSRTPAGTNSGGSVSAHTLTTNEIPSHTHTYSQMTFPGEYEGSGFPFAGPVGGVTQYPPNPVNSNTAASGGGAAHSHGFTNPTFNGTAMDFAVQYVDLIIASKN
jgi:hypothetical protein